MPDRHPTSDLHPLPNGPAAGGAAPVPLAGLAEQAAALASGEATAAGLVAQALDRAEQTRSTLNAFSVLRREGAQAEADEADRRLASGERLPLLGVPVAVKDDVDLDGVPTPFGCAGTWPAATGDSEVVRRLRAAGAIVVGKTTAAELGQWPVTAGETWGVTRNPWDLDRTPGGSSGGSAAAVSAGIVAAAVGSDGAGSIRIPASWTHLVGIKPQRGRVSTWPDQNPWEGLSVHGPLARSVADAALLLDVLTGNHPEDRVRAPVPATPFAEAVGRPTGRLTIAVSRRFAFNGTPRLRDDEVHAALDRMAGVLRDLGHVVVDAEPCYGPQMGAAFLPMSMVGLREWLGRVPDAEVIDPRISSMGRLGGAFRGPIRAAVRRAEPVLRRQVGRIFRKVDVVMTPTTAVAPLQADALRGLSGWATNQLITGACPYAWPWNVLGWPGVSVPAGVTGAGLPVGVQLLGPEASEARLISLAAQLETVERWHERWPAFAYDLAGTP